MEAVHSVDPGRNGSVSFQRNSGKKKLFILVEKKTIYFGRKKKLFILVGKKQLFILLEKKLFILVGKKNCLFW